MKASPPPPKAEGPAHYSSTLEYALVKIINSSVLPTPSSALRLPLCSLLGENKLLPPALVVDTLYL